MRLPLSVRLGLAIFLCIAVLLPPAALAQCTYVDPQTSISRYEAWCRCVGGTPYSPYGNGVNEACHPPSTSSSSSSVNSAVGNAVEQGLRPIGEAIGQKIASWLFGTSNSNDTADAAAVAEAERQRMLALERQRQLDTERKAQFRQDMQNLQLEIKGPKLPNESLLFKDTNTCSFEANCQSTGGLQFKPIDASSGQQTISDPLDQLRISACLSKMAAAAKTPDETSYLSDQAAKAMQGAALDVDISGCPKDTSVTSEAPVIEKTTVDPNVIQRGDLTGHGAPIFDCDGDRAKIKSLLAGRPGQQTAIDRTEALLNGSEQDYAEAVDDSLVKGTQFLTDASLTAVLRARTLLARAQMMKNTPGTDPQTAARWKLLQKTKEILDKARELEDKAKKVADKEKKIREGRSE